MKLHINGGERRIIGVIMRRSGGKERFGIELAGYFRQLDCICGFAEIIDNDIMVIKDIYGRKEAIYQHSPCLGVTEIGRSDILKPA